MRKIPVQFVCSKCGLISPATAKVPENAHPDRYLDLKYRCIHCGSNLQRLITLRQLLQERDG